eukprot:COSAG01_NODE_6731_length_3524_cov_10.057963_1_plen_148_part_00
MNATGYRQQQYTGWLLYSALVSQRILCRLWKKGSPATLSLRSSATRNAKARKAAREKKNTAAEHSKLSGSVKTGVQLYSTPGSLLPRTTVPVRLYEYDPAAHYRYRYPTGLQILRFMSRRCWQLPTAPESRTLVHAVHVRKFRGDER